MGKNIYIYIYIKDGTNFAVHLKPTHIIIQVYINKKVFFLSLDLKRIDCNLSRHDFFRFILFITHSASLVAQLVKNAPAMWETCVWSPGWEDPLEKGKATHPSILAWRVRHDWLSNFHFYFGASLIAQLVKNPLAMSETPVWLQGQEDPLEKG